MPMDIDQIRALSNDDMQAVNQLIQQQVDSDVALINQLGFLHCKQWRQAITPTSYRVKCAGNGHRQ